MSTLDSTLSGAGPDPADAFRSLKRVRRARSVARFNGWSMLVLALPAIVFGLFDPSSLIVGAVLGLLAWRELRWGERLGRLDRRAPGRLAVNQILLLAAVLAYCAWKTWAGLTGPSLVERHPELAELGADLDGLTRTLTIAVYATVAGLSLPLMGLTAWYYASRAAHVDRLLGAGESLRFTARDATAA